MAPETTTQTAATTQPQDPLAGKKYRNFRVAIRAAFAGVKTGSLTNIPSCPEYWADIEEWWDGPAMVANVAKIMIYGIILFNVANGKIPSALLSIAGIGS